MSYERLTDPAFSLEEYARRIAKTREAMAARGIELMIVNDPSNMSWLTGYDGWSFYVHQCVLLAMEGDPVWFGRGQDAQGAVRTVFMDDEHVVGYPDHYVQASDIHPVDYLSTVILERGWDRLAIGVEWDNYWYTARGDAVLRHHLPNATVIDATGLVNWQRAVKSDEELAFMRIAARRVEKMHARILDKVEPGIRKCDLVAEIYDAGLRYDPEIGAGGDYPAIVPLLPSGSDAAAPHLTWDDKPMKAGEGTFFEIAGTYRRYHCPLSRTVFLGKPTPIFLDAEKATLDAMEAGLEAVRPGATCDDVASAFFRTLGLHGFEKDNRTGYPIGLSYPPDWGERTMSLRRGDRSVLEAGMTFHFMSGLWLEEVGIEITESFVVTETGHECLANVPRKLFVKD
ncbi:MAG: ectoine hydrolase DoeA [Paracoccaceae bacterium]